MVIHGANHHNFHVSTAMTPKGPIWILDRETTQSWSWSFWGRWSVLSLLTLLKLMWKLWNPNSRCGTMWNPMFFTVKIHENPYLGLLCSFFVSQRRWIDAWKTYMIQDETMEPQCHWFLMIIQCRHCEAKKNLPIYEEDFNMGRS